MKEKDKYTFEELCEGLTIPISEFCRRSGVTEGTLARLRQGFSARRVTINKLLETFSKIYELDFSLDNVTGLALEDKKEIRRQMLIRKGIPEKAEKTPSLPKVRTTKAKADKPKTRDYSQREEVPIYLEDGITPVPEGTVSYHTFARKFGINERTFRDWIDKREIEAIIFKNPNRPREKYRLLMLSQQYKAVQWLQEHKPEMFTPPEESSD